MRLRLTALPAFFFEITRPGLSVRSFDEGLKAHGVRMCPVGPTRLRAVTHLDVDRDGIDRALRAARAVLGS